MDDYGSYCGSHEHVELSIETRLGQSSYPRQICHFLFRSLGQITGNQIIMFVLLKVVTINSVQHSEHLSTSDCHSSEHNSVLLVF